MVTPPLCLIPGGEQLRRKIQKRKIDVPAPGGNEWSHDADEYKGLSNYVHLCFKDSHPMEFAARQDGRIKDVIYLKVIPAVLDLPEVLFSPDVSNKSSVNTMPIAEAVDVIDFDVLYTWVDWKDPEIQKRRKQAEKYEILVPKKIPLSMIVSPYHG